ncbi:hypothetical protein [Lysobacter capsici]|uniref:hypothetical protein n=1 Tax=Lysobacter capsici TaxID=435897 RepID=UPI001C003631|nr:hypothetical protein [Lysobacter capsici]QWF18681.1 hypothetical protein KME82_08050 [Lysobacter capsici]
MKRNLEGWSKPYFGVQHFGAGGSNSFWATVHDYSRFAISLVWTPGCGFSPIETQHDNADEARKHAESQLFVLTRGQTGADHR